METPGTRFLIDPANLPAPQPGSSVNNPSTTVPRPPGTLPQVPAGFQVSVFAEGVGQARWLQVALNGDVLLARPDLGDVLLLRDGDRNGVAELRTTLASGFRGPEGMAVQAGGLYVADADHVWRVPYSPGDTAAGVVAVPITAAGALGPATGHGLRPLAFSQDGRSFFVGVGSATNLAAEEAPRATILQFDADGDNPRVYASGLRNPAGLEVAPGTGELYATVVERDGMGDELVPDFLTRVRSGGFYGWPYAYIGSHPQPGFAERRPDLVAQSITPDVLFQAHSTPLDFAFYGGGQFPEAYTGDAFVALHGSWNAATPRGFMVARVSIENGVPVNGYEAFMTGFRTDDDSSAEAYGRPSTVAVLPDGGLLVGDNSGGTIYEVRYVAPNGDALDNHLVGGSGADRIEALAGNDTIDAGGGADTIDGGAGSDWVNLGGAGGVCLIASTETLIGGAGADWVNLGDGRNTIILAAIETLIGGAGDDAVALGNRGNTLILAAVETLIGGAGQDFVMLGNRGSTLDVSGVEVLVGGAARDEITVTVTAGAIQFDGRGGADRVVLNAGGGADRILFDLPADDGFDEVSGFQGGLDQVFALATLHLRVDRNADAALSAATRNGGTVDLRTDELVRLTNPVGMLNDADYASFRAALGSVATGGAAASALVLASDGYNDGLYLLTDDGDGAVAAGEVRLIARFDGARVDLGDVRLG